MQGTEARRGMKAMPDERPLEPDEEILTVKEIAKQLRVTEKTVRNWITNGELAAFDLGKGYRIRRRDYDDFLRNRYKGPQN